MERKYLSVKSVAKRYEIGVSTVWLRVKEGRLPPGEKIHGTSTRWDIDKLVAHEANQAEGV